MESEKVPQTPQESLDIITGMIKQAKGNMRANSFYFLLWGWVVSIASVGMFVLIRLEYEKPWLIWLITIPTWMITLYTIYRKERRSSKTTHFDIITTALWISYGIIIFTFVFFMEQINYNMMPIILIITAVPVTVSGVMLKFRLMIFGGVTFWLAGILCFLVASDIQFLVGAGAIVLGYLVPGYALRNKRDN